MIKRFNITVLDGQCLAAMSAHGEGSYVRYADIADLLEEKTLEQHREEFEGWTRDHYFLCEVTLHRDGDDYSDLDMDLAWEAWKAARGVEK